MKTMFFRNQIPATVFFAILIGTFISCKEDTIAPDFVGTWVRTDSMEISKNEKIPLLISTLSMTSSTFNFKFQLNEQFYLESVLPSWKDAECSKGSLKVENKTLTFSVNEVGEAPRDSDGRITGDLIYYKEDDAHFNTLVGDDKDTKKVNKFEYAISGNNFFVKVDRNGDGDFNDEDEITNYLKQ